MDARASSSLSIFFAKSQVKRVSLSFSSALSLDAAREDEDDKVDFRDHVVDEAECCVSASLNSELP